jgi:hypothetical protein
MRRIHITAALGLIAVVVGLPGVAADQGVTFDKTFLTDYSRLVPRESPNGKDFAYIAPQAIETAIKYKGVMSDQPEILISPNSEYKGSSPQNLASVANSMRDAMDARLEAGGYNVVDKPGPGVLYVRLALTDLELKKKKRSLLAYTPAGAVLKFGVDALKDFQSKYDIMNMVFQMEVVDSVTNQVLAQYVAVRGGGDKPIRMDFDQVKANMDEFGERFRCRLDNSRGPIEKQINCLDPAARKAREDAQAH